VVGYCTGGGLSWFSRPYGSGAGSLRAAEIVDATGLRRWVDDSSDAELMWAIRGGGGNFGIITSVEVELFAAPEITGGRLMFPIDQAEAVLTAYGSATVAAADHVTLWAYLTHFPDVPFVPEPVRGKSFCMIDAITPYEPAALEAALAPIRAAGTPMVDTIRPHEPGSIGEITPGSGDPASLLIGSTTFDEFSPEVIGMLLKHVGGPIFQVQVRHLRASDEVGHVGVAASDPAAQYCALLWAPVPLPEYEAPAREALLALKDAMAPWHAGELPPSSLGAADSLQDAISEPDLARLREIKQKVDPLGILVGNYPLS
jgi:FAD/FMN-containing dehydrogenase